MYSHKCLKIKGTEKVDHVSANQNKAAVGGSMVKNPPPVQETWIQSLARSGRPSGEGNGNPLQYSCLGNPIDRGALWATVCGIAKSQTRLSKTITTFHVKARLTA